jgi:hypothetical protein
MESPILVLKVLIGGSEIPALAISKLPFSRDAAALGMEIRQKSRTPEKSKKRHRNVFIFSPLERPPG